MERPMMEHWQAIKQILRYVAGTLDSGLRYEQCSGGILFFLGNCLVSW
jgi:hypothetical protein